MFNSNLVKNTLLSILPMCCFLLFACSKQESLQKLDLGLNYFPLKMGSVIIYDVDSTVYNDFNNTVTTYNFQLKDSVLYKYIDLTNKEVFRIERFKKMSNADSWNFQQVIVKNLVGNSRAEEFADNHRFVRLVFPQNLGLKWNGNLYNNMEEWPYEITKLYENMTIGTKNIDSTLTVSQYNEVNLIREDVYSEVYAKNIGLVVKNIRAIDKDISTGKIKKGIIYKMQLNSNR